EVVGALDGPDPMRLARGLAADHEGDDVRPEGLADESGRRRGGGVTGDGRDDERLDDSTGNGAVVSGVRRANDIESGADFPREVVVGERPDPGPGHHIV